MDAVRVLLFALLLSGLAVGGDHPGGERGGSDDGERRGMREVPDRGEGARGEGFHDGFRGDGPGREGFRGDGRRGEGLRGEGYREGWGRFSREEPTEEEWTEAAAFVQAHSPNRWRFYEEAEEDRLRLMLRRQIVRQYERLDDIGKKDEDLLEIKIRQIEVEDEVFGMLRKLPEDDPSLEGSPPEPIAAKLRMLIELRFAEREYHIRKLEEALNEERTQLAHDESDIDEKVEEQWEKWSRLWGPRGQELREKWRQRREERESSRDEEDGRR